MSTMSASEGASTRRAALLAALGGSIGGFMPLVASARKKRQKKRKRCPSTCPVRVACACGDGTCSYLPFDGNLNEVAAACQARCGGVSDFQALVSGPTSAASCTLFGEVAPIQCPLV